MSYYNTYTDKRNRFNTLDGSPIPKRGLCAVLLCLNRLLDVSCPTNITRSNQDILVNAVLNKAIRDGKYLAPPNASAPH